MMSKGKNSVAKDNITIVHLSIDSTRSRRQERSVSVDKVKQVQRVLTQRAAS